MKIAVLFSGGKDSTYAIWFVQHQGWEISTLLTVRPELSDSLMFHHPNVEWTGLQAEAMSLPHRMVEATGKDELTNLAAILTELNSRQGVSGLVTGAVASDFQKTRFENMCDSVGLKTYSPLWHKSPKLLVDDFGKAGFRITFTAVAAEGLDASWLGREVSGDDWSRLEKLSKVHGIHLTGEGGEYESFVLDAPNFHKSVEIEKSRTEWNGDRGTLVIEAASLRDKLGQ